MRPVRYGLHTLLWMALTLGATGQSTPQGSGNRETRNSQPVGKTINITGDDGQPFLLYTGSYALVIGISKYTNGWRPLTDVPNDVTAVSAVLKKHGFNVETLLDPTRTKLEETMRQFIASHGHEEGNRILVYYSGHGYSIKREQSTVNGYIVPVDAPLPEIDQSGFIKSAISMRSIDSLIHDIRSKHALFVFDSCFAGTIFDGTKSNPPPAAITWNTARNVRQFITAGTSEQEVPQTSIFRRQFVAALEGTEADGYPDGYITGTELGNYIYNTVTRYSKTTTPQSGKLNNPDYDKGDFVFKVLGTPETPKKDEVSAPSDDLVRVNVEVTFWNSVKDSKDPADLEDYLEKYPNGQFATLARRRLAQLKAGARRVTEAPPVNAPPYRQTSFQTGQIIDGVWRPSSAECEVYTEDLGNGALLEMVKIPAGSFVMGSPAREQGRDSDEGPQREVRVAGFLMGRYEVTQRLWKAVAALPRVGLDLNADPARFKGEKLPVEQVTWEEVKEFIARLNNRLGLSEKNGYRLPSEAEWEYAARAGTRTPFAFGETIDPTYVNYNGNYPYGKGKKGPFRQQTIEVGSLGLANGFGLFDMHGNVWEWCEDDWHANYTGAPTDQQAWVEASRAAFRVIRGGSWRDYAVYCRSASRDRSTPGYRYDHLGFRLSRTLP